MTRRGRGHLANDSWEALLTAHAVLMKRFAAAPIWDEVSMREYDVLYTLAKQDRPIRLGELNRNVLLSQPALSRLVERLADRGLVERAPDPADGRGVRLALTEAGREQQRRTGRRHAADVAREVGAALGDEEMRTLEALTRKLAGQDRPSGEAEEENR
ncbi:MarR family winged helix-turn-helix transcriptional regulator [Glycomyces tenuis]|uniref:MarR family winged helix-turn-helix transcriptional regulator n=1 Tax=Glycomyces tenuis TaxID=58116 RepID=UPI00041F18D6|nr:MarR family transcriptional regulator [Glycomyces tenuis]